MFRSSYHHKFLSSLVLLITLVASPVALFAQQTGAGSAPPELTRPTILTRPATPDAVLVPAPSAEISDITQMGMTGILVETLDGKPVMEQLANIGFNPASGVKLATALAALRTFGPEYRFTTAVWTTGRLDTATGTIHGDLIVSGRDPSFHYEHAVQIARELNRMGVHTVTGDLIVAPRFTMNFDGNSQRSGEQFYDTLDATRRPAQAVRAWNDVRFATGDTASLPSMPSVAVMGAVYVEAVPAGARTLLTHRSSKLTDVLKVLLCYSNNFMAERIGDTLGRPGRCAPRDDKGRGSEPCGSQPRDH